MTISNYLIFINATAEQKQKIKFYMEDLRIKNWRNTSINNIYTFKKNNKSFFIKEIINWVLNIERN